MQDVKEQHLEYIYIYTSYQNTPFYVASELIKFENHLIPSDAPSNYDRHKLGSPYPQKHSCHLSKVSLPSIHLTNSYNNSYFSRWNNRKAWQFAGHKNVHKETWPPRFGWQGLLWYAPNNNSRISCPVWGTWDISSLGYLPLSTPLAN